MAQNIRLQGDSNAHDRPWRVAVEQGFFKAEGLNVEYHEDNPKGVAGRVENFSERWKDPASGRARSTSIRFANGARSSACSSSAAARSSGSTPRRAPAPSWCARIPRSRACRSSRNIPIAVTWHAGTFYAAVEVLEEAGVPFNEIKLEHANDRLDALLSGKNEAAALMEPLVSRAVSAGCRKLCDLRWRGGIVASDDIDDETAQKSRARSTARSSGCAQRRALARGTAARSHARAAQDRHDAGTPRRAELQSVRIPGEGRLDGWSAAF